MAFVCLVKGNLVRWRNGPEGDIGVAEEILPGGRVRVRFDRNGEMTFAWPTDVLERVRFREGSMLESVSERIVGVVAGIIEDEGLLYYRLNLPGGDQRAVIENSLRAALITDPIALLRSGNLHTAWSCNLRTTATRLQFAHQFDELSCLSNSRVAIKPHQVAVLHRVVASYPHRFLLCDEVGLGKTIEAGLIMKELKARGAASRVLVLAPANLVSQWQYELKTKFNEVFSLYNKATTELLQAENPAENVWTLRDNVITSTTFASWDNNRQKQIALAGWDLIILDEAHHARRYMQGEARYTQTNLYELIQMLTDPQSGRSVSILMLTATPMQLDRFELYSLIDLLDPTLFPNPRDFNIHCSLLAGLNQTAESLRRWPALSPSEKAHAAEGAAKWLGKGEDLVSLQLEDETIRARYLEEIIAKHRLSQVLIRNRKAVVGGFMPRVAVKWEVELTAEEKRAYDAVTNYARTGYSSARLIQNNALGFLMVTFQKLNSSSSFALRQSLLRRIQKLRDGLAGWVANTDVDVDDEAIEEYPLDESLGEVLEARHELAVDGEIQQLNRILALLDQIGIDSKAHTLLSKLGEILEQEKAAKVIIFTQFRDTQEYLRQLLHDRRWGVHLFHGQLKPEEKDSAVARFKEGTGPQVLISTESGGEGRNFQFAHILINYDFPWNPMKIEQRIGRLDRIGQKSPVTVINFSLLGTVEERVLEVVAQRIRVFEETIGGLDPILGDVENDIKRIYMMAEAEANRALSRLDRQLEIRVQAAREAERHMADFIMDTRSYRQDEVQQLLEKRSPMTHEALSRFVVSSLKQLGSRVDPIADSPGIYEVRLRGQFLAQFPQFEKEANRTVTFDPMVALDHEEVEFLAFGHELVDALVGRTRKREFPGLASCRRIVTDDVQATRGWFFTYSLEFEGVRKYKEVLPVFVGMDGTRDPELATWLLERASLLYNEEGRVEDLPPRDGAFDNAVSVAELVALRRMTARQEELAAKNREQLEQERAKLEHYYVYRARAAEEKLQSVQRTFDNVSSSDDPEVLRIAPVWKKNLENATRDRDNVAVEREKRLGALSGRERVAAQQGLLTASFVEILSKDPGE